MITKNSERRQNAPRDLPNIDQQRNRESGDRVIGSSDHRAIGEMSSCFQITRSPDHPMRFLRVEKPANPTKSLKFCDNLLIMVQLFRPLQPSQDKQLFTED